MPAELRIPPEVLSEVYARAGRGWPREVCGVLVGPRDANRVDEVRRCANEQDRLHAEDPEAYPRDSRTAYNLAAADLLYVQRSLDGPRPVKVIYHSHVDVGAYFSEEDRRAALFGGSSPAYPVQYLVVDVRGQDVGGGRAGGAKLFAWDGAAFVEAAAWDAAGNRHLDLRGERCPYTFARAKLALEGMERGEVLRLLLDNAESARNVPRTFEAQGQDVLETIETEPGVWSVAVEKVREW